MVMHRPSRRSASSWPFLPAATCVAMLPANGGSTLILASEQEDDEVIYGQTRSLVFLTLLQEGDDGEVIGNLARSWTNSVDGTDWTFHLRSDVRWHNSVPVTARDLAFTFELFRDLSG
jgi:ABC-type transport system substrate-binding protein